MKNRYDKVAEILKEYNQEHLLKFYDKLTDIEKDKLLNQIDKVDFKLNKRLYDDVVVNNKNEINNLSEVSPLKPADVDDMDKHKMSRLSSEGLELIKKGQVAALAIAGGQGTRLGHTGPKGTFDIGLPSHKSLFQLHCERLINLSKKTGTTIPWYIMTSPENNNDTVEFFIKNNYFGYDSSKIMFFVQEELPLLDEEGKIILEDCGRLKTGANGNGGLFVSAKNAGVIEDMKKKGIKWVFLYGIDNALVKVADPLFIGYAEDSGLEAASKAVKKANADEKVGVICYRNGHPDIVEYSEIPEKISHSIDEQGNLLFNNANIISFLFKLDYFEKCADYSIPYHVAHKKVEGLDKDGNHQKPDKPNGYKFELFMFDVFKYLDDMAVLRVKREEEFAPVKNKEGADSPETARNMIFALHKKWIESSGIDYNSLNDKEKEVSPLVSYFGEGLSVK